jgi:replicative DNA helicase
MMIDSRAVDAVVPILKASDFYHPGHQSIYDTIVQLRDQAIPIDLITVAKSLSNKNTLEQVGGPNYLSELLASVPTTANAELYAQIVRDNSVLRSLIRLCNEIISQCYQPSANSKTILEQAERKILELAVNRRAHQIMHASEMSIQLTSEIQRLTELHYTQKKTILTGIPTGYSTLDRAINGLNKSEFIIIAARTSLGKTTLAINIASHIALNLKRPVGYFSLEMPWIKIGFRIIASVAGVDLFRLQHGELRPSDQSNIGYAVSRLYEAPLYIDDTPHISLLDLRAQARRMVNQYKVEVIFIDYISIINVEDKNLPRHEQVAEISRSLMSLSRELNIPIVALSQVTRDSEGKRPGLHNIRESGSLEQDADIIIFLHREREYQRSESEAGGPIPTELIIAKNRQGDTTVIPMVFLGNQTRFELAEIER